MSTYREAIAHVRSGGTAKCGGKEIRFLTFEEAEPILLEQCPERRVGKNGAIEVVAPADYDVKHLGLYDVGVHPAEQFRPTEEDMQADWTVDAKPVVEEPQVVPPEAVDEALAETMVASDFDEKIGPHKGEEL